MADLNTEDARFVLFLIIGLGSSAVAVICFWKARQYEDRIINFWLYLPGWVFAPSSGLIVGLVVWNKSITQDPFDLLVAVTLGLILFLFPISVLIMTRPSKPPA